MELADMETAGLFGVVTETGTSPVTGNFAIIQCLIDTTFSTFTENNGNGDAVTGVDIPAGTFLLGRITAFTLSSGAVRAHNAAPLKNS